MNIIVFVANSSISINKKSQPTTFLKAAALEKRRRHVPREGLTKESESKVGLQPSASISIASKVYQLSSTYKVLFIRMMLKCVAKWGPTLNLKRYAEIKTYTHFV